MTDAVPETDESTPRPVEGFKALGFFTADHAVVESGKVYANGAYFQNLNFPAFPFTLPTLTVVAVIQVPWHANNHDHNFEIALMDSDGRTVPNIQVRGQFRGAAGPDMKYGEPGLMPIALPLFGMTFERAGDFSFVLRIDDFEIDRYPIRVRQVAFPGGPPLPTRSGPIRPTDF